MKASCVTCSRDTCSAPTVTLRGGPASIEVALGVVLLAGAGGLDHLIDGAVAAAREPLAEAACEVEDGLGLLVGAQVAVAAVKGD